MGSSTVRHLLLLLLIAAVIYLTALGLQDWDGNETMRVIIAKEMLKTGNWIMPVLHGKLYFTKPPLMNWLIAASGSLFGDVNEWTSRLPSVLMTFLTGISVYFLTKRWLEREGRFFAAIMVISMIGLIRMGRMAEIESLNVWIISSILLVWINGYVRQWRPAVLWGLTLSLAGIGFFSKGPHAIVFFYMTVIPYLLLKKRISFFFSKAHVFGIGLFIMVLSVYLSLVLQWTTLNSYLHVWIREGVARTESGQLSSYVRHFIAYPLQLAIYFMPCLLFLIPVLINRDLRQEAKKAFRNEIFVFSVVVVAANFPLYWLLPNTRYKYFLSAGPFVALITAAIFELYVEKIKASPDIGVFFVKILKTLALSVILIAVSAIPVIILSHLAVSFPIFFLIACVLFAAIAFLYRINSARLIHAPVFIALITGLFYIAFTDISVGYDSKKGNTPKNIAREINLILPGDVDVVYEIGYKRFLPVTCYINREVIQIDSFAELPALKKKKGRVYFIYDTALLNMTSNEERNVLLNEIRWEKIYSKEFRDEKRDIVVGVFS